MDRMDTHQLLDVQEARSMTYVKAYDNQVGFEKSPRVWAAGVVELKAVLSLSGADVKHKRLVHVPQKLDRCLAIEIVTPLADPAGSTKSSRLVGHSTKRGETPRL
jgi:hypothetical protein